MSASFDLAILGSGFAGSLTAMIARRLGLRVILLERGQHPRFVIGESTSPLTNLLLEEIADEYDLPRLKPLASFGAWKRTYPDLPVGLKRGFTFYSHTAGQPFTPDPNRQRQLLVAASPNDEVADTHWYRPAFDHFLVQEAQRLGAEYVDRVVIDAVQRIGGITRLSGSREGQAVSYSARWVIDATGPNGALTRLLGLPVEEFPRYPQTEALYSHFTQLHRFAEQSGTPGTPPYPPDDAALHHVFDGGWMWILRFDNGITSAGFAVEDWLASELRLEDREGAWQRFLARFPSVGQQFEGSEMTLPLMHQRRIAYFNRHVSGDGWTLLPSASSFVDPLFSTGFPLTLLGIQRLGRALKEWSREGDLPIGDYAEQTVREVETTATLVAACYRLFPRFQSFTELSMLYFVAASYAEMARRLRRFDLAPGFLMRGREAFHRPFMRHCEAALAGAPSSPEFIAQDMGPFNIAGLCDPTRRNWYPIELEDTLRGAAKLEATEEQLIAVFEACGLSCERKRP